MGREGSVQNWVFQTEKTHTGRKAVNVSFHADASSRTAIQPVTALKALKPRAQRTEQLRTWMAGAGFSPLEWGLTDMPKEAATDPCGGVTLSLTQTETVTEGIVTGRGTPRGQHTHRHFLAPSAQRAQKKQSLNQ